MDAIFKALADPARLALMDSLRTRDGQTLSELEAQLDMTRFGVMKHLKVLEDTHLIVTRRKGRFKHHYLNAVPLQEAIDHFIDPYRAKPAARAILELKSRLEGATDMQTEPKAKPDFVLSTYIRCTQDALWDALTDPDAISAWHFVSPKVTRQGNAFTYLTPEDGTMMVCRTLEVEPKRRIVSTFEPHWAEGIPASRTVFHLIPEARHMKLVVEHFDLHFPVVPGEGVADGWERWASGLKTYLETGTPARFNETGSAG